MPKPPFWIDKNIKLEDEVDDVERKFYQRFTGEEELPPAQQFPLMTTEAESTGKLPRWAKLGAGALPPLGLPDLIPEEQGFNFLNFFLNPSDPNIKGVNEKLRNQLAAGNPLEKIKIQVDNPILNPERKQEITGQEILNNVALIPMVGDVMPIGGLGFIGKGVATSKILSRISLQEEAPGFFQKIKGGWSRFSTAMLDDLHPIRKFTDLARKTGTAVSMEEDPYIWARLLRGLHGKVSAFLEDGTFGKAGPLIQRAKGKVDIAYKGKSLRQILGPIAGKEDDLTAYLVAKRSIELSKKQIKTGITIKDARAAIKELDKSYPQFKQTADDLYKYQNDLLEYAHESGLINAELLAKLQANKAYVPFYRVFEGMQAKGLMGKKMANIVSPIKRIRGSEREIINPLESIVKNTSALISAADRNQVGIMMANLVRKNPELVSLFQPIKTPIRKVAQVTAKQLGIKLEGVSDDIAEQVFDIFRPTTFSKDGVLSVIIDGKRKFFQVDPELYKGLLTLNRESMGMIGEMLSLPAKWLRAGATLSPDFMVRNPLRDQMTAFTYSKYGFMPGIDFMHGLASMLRKDNIYKLYRASGAERAMLVSMDRQYLNKGFREIIGRKGIVNYVKHPLELLQILSEAGEKATRLGEFRLGIRKGASTVAASFSSREVTLDFAKMGTTARAVNALVAFWNANIRGWDRMISAFKNNPISTSMKVFAGITFPSIALYAVNRTDPRWKEIPQWQKDLFWIVMTENNIYRIPKPFELGVLFGSIPERFLEYLDEKDPEALNEVIANAAEAGSPGFIPTALLPIIENMTNFSLFRDRPIVPESRQDLPPQLQYGRFTSETAKKIGEFINYSPAKIDNLMLGYTGGLGRYATDILDGILKGTGVTPVVPEPAPEVADKPVIKAFVVRNPYGSSSQSIDRFYDKLEELQSGEQLLKEMIKLGKEQKFNNYKQEHPEVLFFYDFSRDDFYSGSARYLRRVARQMSEIRDKQSQVYEHSEMTPERKRLLINQMDAVLTDLARNALEALANPGIMIQEERGQGDRKLQTEDLIKKAISGQGGGRDQTESLIRKAMGR